MCETCKCETQLISTWGVVFTPCACPKNVDDEINKTLKVLEEKLVQMGVSESA